MLALDVFRKIRKLTKSLLLLMILFSNNRSRTVMHFTYKQVVSSSSSIFSNIEAEQSMTKMQASRPAVIVRAGSSSSESKSWLNEKPDVILSSCCCLICLLSRADFPTVSICCEIPFCRLFDSRGKKLREQKSECTWLTTFAIQFKEISRK